MASRWTPALPAPPNRQLRVYAFDPQASIELDTSGVNDAVITLPWDRVEPGPCCEHFEVIDHDPASGLYYTPVDLDEPVLLAQCGLPPSEGRPQFHQQMVYAVAKKTVLLFERALGRAVLWASENQVLRQRRAKLPRGDAIDRDLVARLRIYPHALREANAYYSPAKTALMFGYFRPPEHETDPTNDRWVFTCLSQDIIVHETAHAILHGMHRRSVDPSNDDTLAFHEGFADIVALLQHFTMDSVVAHQIARERGKLRGNTLLTGLARQFGQAIGRQGALRYALDLIDRQRNVDLATDPAERQKRLDALPKLAETIEPHDRGGFLVAAIFDAFVTIYESRTADLFRIAHGSSTPTGAELSPDLVKRLAREASKSADHVLRMCVRALDYVSPVDLRFGEYLRAIVTADADLIPDDTMRYRVAVADAFRKCGIPVQGAISMAPDSLIWEAPDPEALPKTESGQQGLGLFAGLLPTLRLSQDFNPNERQMSPRDQNITIIKHNQRLIHQWINEPDTLGQDRLWESLLGVKQVPRDKLRDGDTPLESIVRNKAGIPKVEVHSARVARRRGPDGQVLDQLVVQITQRRGAFMDLAKQEQADAQGFDGDPDFWFRGGATLLIDLSDGRLRTVIRKRIDNDTRLETERHWRMGAQGGLAMAVYDDPDDAAERVREPFALIHRS